MIGSVSEFFFHLEGLLVHANGRLMVVGEAVGLGKQHQTGRNLKMAEASVKGPQPLQLLREMQDLGFGCGDGGRNCQRRGWRWDVLRDGRRRIVGCS